MLYGDDNKVTAQGNPIKETEKQRDILKIGMSKAMGIGSENKGKDMLEKEGLYIDLPY